MSDRSSFKIHLPKPEDTATLGVKLAAVISPGDCLLLSGPIGAGKTHFARALIQEWLSASGLWEDVPSPTFTIVQTYSNGSDELWHIDLYRITSTSELEELGLFYAFENAIVVVEWPDRLGDDAPTNALSLHLAVENSGRLLEANGPTHLISGLEGKR